MSAFPVETRRLQPLMLAMLDDLLTIETQAYAFPWSPGNFIDSLAAGYLCRVLRGARGEWLGYFIAMPGAAEMHLLNITVTPEQQGRGHARFMLDALVEMSRESGAAVLWLEVRKGNPRARSLYARYGFKEVGVRPRYYPDSHGRREDAVVMSLSLSLNLGTASDAAVPAGVERGRHGVD